jgi:hypothetical protein
VNAIELENFRLAILKVAAANLSRWGLGLVGFKLHVARFGFNETTVAEIGPEVDYLAGKGLMEPVAKHLSPENRAWRITPAGRDFLAEREL